MPIFVDPKTGDRYETEEPDAGESAQQFGLVPEAQFEKDRAEAAKPIGQKAIETAATGFAGAAAVGGEIGKAIPEWAGGLSPEESQQADEFARSTKVGELREAHPVAFAVGTAAPTMGISGALGGGIGAMVAESAATGLATEAVDSTQQGREFSPGGAAESGAYDLAFSAAAAAASSVVSRVGNLLLFGGGNTMARNLKRGFDSSGGPVVADDVRFEGPLLEAETRSTRAAKATAPGMPPGPERDEMLRRAAPDLNQQVVEQGGAMFDATADAARKSAAVGESEAIRRRVDDFLTETTPAQTSWSADATRRLDSLRASLDAVGDDPVAAPLAARARAAADEAIAAIDGSGDSAAWFTASSRARARLDALADDIAASDLPSSGVVSTSVGDARIFLDQSLSDRSLFGQAAEMHAGLTGAARDQIGAAKRAAGGDLRGQLYQYVAGDATERATLRGPLDQAIDGFEDLARQHERFGTATPRQIELLQENAATLRRGLSLADDVQGAARRTQAAASARPDRVVDTVMAGLPNTATALATDALAKLIARRINGAISGLGAAAGGSIGGGPGAMVGAALGNAVAKRYGPTLAKQIMSAAAKYAKKNGHETAAGVLLGATALDDSDGSGASMAGVIGLGLLTGKLGKLLPDEVTALNRGKSSLGYLRKGSPELTSALEKTAVDNPGTLFRGMRVTQDQLDGIVKDGYAIDKLTTAAVTRGAAETFASGVNGKVPVLMQLEGTPRASLAHGYEGDEFLKEKTAILPVGTRYRVAKVEDVTIPPEMDWMKPEQGKLLTLEAVADAPVNPNALSTGKATQGGLTPSMLADAKRGSWNPTEAPSSAGPSSLTPDEQFTAQGRATRSERAVRPTQYESDRQRGYVQSEGRLADTRGARIADNARAGALGNELTALQKAGLLTGAGVAGGLALEGTASAAESDPRLDAANRIVSVDAAATSRIRHTARVLSGLADPPGPAGLTTSLARFGAEHDDPWAAFEDRKAILESAEVSPELVYDVIGSTLGDVASVSPELYQAVSARVLDGFRYMRENLPAEVKSSLVHPRGVPPSQSAMRDWATQWNTVMDPESVLDDIDNGTVTNLQVRTLQGAHPDTYQQLRGEIIAEVGANFADIPTSTKMQLDILFQADGLAGPMFSSAAAVMIGEASKAASKQKQPMPQGSESDGDAVDGARGLSAIASSVTNRGV